MFEIRFNYHPRSKVAEWQTLVFIGVVLRTRWARSQAGKQGSKSHVSSNRLLSLFLFSQSLLFLSSGPSIPRASLRPRSCSRFLRCSPLPGKRGQDYVGGDNRQIQKTQRSNYNCTVQAPRGAPTPSVSWFQDGKLVKEGPGKKIEVIFQN